MASHSSGEYLLETRCNVGQLKQVSPQNFIKSTHLRAHVPSVAHGFVQHAELFRTLECGTLRRETPRTSHESCQLCSKCLQIAYQLASNMVLVDLGCTQSTTVRGLTIRDGLMVVLAQFRTDSGGGER